MVLIHILSIDLFNNSFLTDFRADFSLLCKEAPTPQSGKSGEKMMEWGCLTGLMNKNEL